MSVESGKIFGFLDANGAGKTPILATAFYPNPLTYLVDVARASIFGNFSIISVPTSIVLIVGAVILLGIATKPISKLEI